MWTSRRRWNDRRDPCAVIYLQIINGGLVLLLVAVIAVVVYITNFYED